MSVDVFFKLDDAIAAGVKVMESQVHEALCGGCDNCLSYCDPCLEPHKTRTYVLKTPSPRNIEVGCWTAGASLYFCCRDCNEDARDWFLANVAGAYLSF